MMVGLEYLGCRSDLITDRFFKVYLFLLIMGIYIYRNLRIDKGS